MVRGLCFGTFDGFHEGHDVFLIQAKNLCDELIVCVARDAHIRLLKRREPRLGEEVRLRVVADHPCVTRAVLSDETLGSYLCLKTFQPDLILLGHDQGALANDLMRFGVETGERFTIRFLQRLERTPSKSS